jgi:predicted amino acid racemase
MNRLVLDLEALQHNLRALEGMMQRHGASWCVVTKALCGHEQTIRALVLMGVRSVADSRLDNLEALSRVAPELEKWYLRLPHLSVIPQVVALSDVSLNSEIEVIRALSDEARRQGRIHRIVIMIELGDLREGILPGSLVPFYRRVFEMPGIEVIGVGAQLGCLAGAVPNVDQLAQLSLYRELLELKYRRRLPIISAGSSNFLDLLQKGGIPRSINHFRIGEALFLGTDLVNGGTLPGLRDDAVRVEGEIAEIKEKSLIPLGETGSTTPFEALEDQDEPQFQPGQRGFRAVLTMGQLDTDVAGLMPVNESHQIAGASSDMTVVNLGENPAGLRVGDNITFRPNYSAFVRLMNDGYIRKDVEPDLATLEDTLREGWDLEVPKILEDLVVGPDSKQVA